MKLTESRLRQIIREEMNLHALQEEKAQPGREQVNKEVIGYLSKAKKPLGEAITTLLWHLGHTTDSEEAPASVEAGRRVVSKLKQVVTMLDEALTEAEQLNLRLEASPTGRIARAGRGEL